ncbi:serine hydrolase domain-containing protein [Variovorax sp. PAMC26660]|uniref:serine hydrolase domain-containing protein n=1 Tax=Variovorax sp. PAMC26660 TaxID=2762322 RepID=UPI00164E8CC7|nr:serine hydrolase [Variovorax sp. PAMC26660]QNK68538.1 serine hydrolase [Variovorax sp. PAMC26660]
MRVLAFCLATVCLLLAGACTAPLAGNAGAAVFPLSSWEFVPPAQLSTACNRQLDAAREYLKTLDTTAVMAVQGGRVLFSEGPLDAVSIVFSVRKSLLSMMYGKYVADGTVDLDRTLADLGIDDLGGLLASERAARLRDLLTARSGVYHAAANGGDDLAFAPARGSQAPGSYFLYNNWDFNAAGTAFEKLTGRSIYRAFADDLAAPLMLEDFNVARHKRSGDSAKSEHLAYPFFLSTRDMARLGYLMLRQGNWRGQQLVPTAWVAQITQPVTTSAQMHPPHVARRGFGYGYLWWLLEEPADSVLSGAYMAWGVHGQYILVIPKRNMVIAHKRQVPVAGNWNPSTVVPGDFLRAARMIATAPCG